MMQFKHCASSVKLPWEQKKELHSVILTCEPSARVVFMKQELNIYIRFTFLYPIRQGVFGTAERVCCYSGGDNTYV